MRKKLRIEPQARVDLLEIWHYIAKDSLEAATRMVEKLEAEIRDSQRAPGGVDGVQGDDLMAGTITVPNRVDSP